MSRTIWWRVVCFAMVAVLVGGSAAAQEALFTPRAEPAADCWATLMSPASEGGYPVCGSCFQTCRSETQCVGKQAGEVCDNLGGTCQVTGGCAVFNCCRCQGPLSAIEAAETSQSKPATGG